MLTEVKNVKQVPGDPYRRWFQDEVFDLIVWFNNDNSLYGFQLCYDKSREERAFTWLPKTGFFHSRVDDGEALPCEQRTPILLPDGDFNAGEILKNFEQESSRVEKEIVDFVRSKIKEYINNLE